mmetsp:Transcript_45757/g.91283  ORF Transcript_45757/g.91283 Transcript_45757/m.91283 type:complete len:222 (-) Transcript_45757:75-740(-)
MKQVTSLPPLRISISHSIHCNARLSHASSCLCSLLWPRRLGPSLTRCQRERRLHPPTTCLPKRAYTVQEREHAGAACQSRGRLSSLVDGRPMNIGFCSCCSGSSSSPSKTTFSLTRAPRMSSSRTAHASSRSACLARAASTSVSQDAMASRDRRQPARTIACREGSAEQRANSRLAAAERPSADRVEVSSKSESRSATSSEEAANCLRPSAQPSARFVRTL